MICRVMGVLAGVEGNAAVVEQPEAGVARQVLLPAYLAAQLGEQIGRPVRLETMEYLEAQGQGASYIPRLIGFSQPSERRFFEVFTSVKGLGNRKALRAMTLPPAEIAAMVAAKDAKGLQQLPEIGKRLAETMIAELSGKVEGFVDPGVVVEMKGVAAAARIAPGAGGAAAEAVEVLLTLGQTQGEAERSVERAVAAATAAGREAATLTGEQIVGMVFGQE